MKKIAIAALLAVSAFSANAATELVTNGNFETGTFAGWTKSGNTSLSDVIRNTTTSNTTYLWRSGATNSPAAISQLLNTVVGGTYTLAFDVYSRGTSNVAFNASFGGNSVYSFTNTQLDWTHVVINNLTATSALTELTFSSQNNPSFTRLDNVSVQAVPEPETYAMMVAGLAALGFMARRRKAA